MTMLRGMIATIGELLQMLWQRRLWWLIPLVLVLMLFGAIVALGSLSGIGPFIYTLF